MRPPGRGGYGRPLGATLVKVTDEYALHAGQAHMLRFAARPFISTVPQFAYGG